MATSAARMPFQHLRDLYGSGTLIGFSDGQLLAHYAMFKDGAAFEALVARHGSMVVATCRAMLEHEHDIEDAFQATFLVLARKAASVRAGDALGGWLHRVAYRIAVQAKRDMRKRQRLESELAAMRISDATRARPDLDLRSIVHEEIERLPERERLSLILCDLEGLTYEQAAGRLRCTVQVLGYRLAKARTRLRNRLVRRGVTATVLCAVTTASTASATTNLPIAWTRAAVAAATGGPASATAVGLSQAMIKGILTLQLKITSAAVLAAIALASVGVVALGTGRPDHPRAAANATGVVFGVGARALRAASGSAENSSALGRFAAFASGEEIEPRSDQSKETAVSFRGRVLGPDGRPVAGAKLYMTLAWGYPHEPSPSPEYATTGPDGRFQFAVPAAEFVGKFTVVAATAPNHGVGWVEVPANGKTDELSIRLAVDDVPIIGEIIDLEGRPVEGATIRLMQINAAPEEELGPWLEAVKAKKDVHLELEQRYFKRFTIAVPLQVTTDSAGRFRLSGIGRNRLVTAQLDGPTIVSQHLHMFTRDGTKIELTDDGRVTTYYGASFRHAAAPTKPIVGVVRDKDTKKPLAGFTIRSLALTIGPNALLGFDLVHTTTDAEGRFRLTGMPKRPGNQIVVIPDRDQQYVPTHKDIPDSPGLGPVTADIELNRGVWIEGKITDKLTGQPLRGTVQYFALSSNPNLGDFPGFDGTFLFLDAGVGTKEDGSYRVVGLPGPGFVAVSRMDHYLTAPERDDEEGVPAAPLFTAPCAITHPTNYGALARIDPAKGAESVKRDVMLDPGWTFTGTVLGPDGKPLAGVQGCGLREGETQFTVRGFNPRRPRDLFLKHPTKGLAAAFQPPNVNGGSVTVQMQPGAVATGKLVDENGQPRADVELWVAIRMKDGSGQWRYSPERIKTDRNGRFRIEGLLPGYEFILEDGKGELSVGDGLRSGQAKDLGDVQIKGQEP